MKYSAQYHVFPATFQVIARKVDYLQDSVGLLGHIKIIYIRRLQSKYAIEGKAKVAKVVLIVIVQPIKILFLLHTNTLYQESVVRRPFLQQIEDENRRHLPVLLSSYLHDACLPWFVLWFINILLRCSSYPKKPNCRVSMEKEEKANVVVFVCVCEWPRIRLIFLYLPYTQKL